MTLNGYFALSSALKVRLSKNNCVKTNKDRQILSGSSKVIDFGTNRKRICNFLLVINSYPGPILSCLFQSYCRFSVQNNDPTPISPKFWGVPLGLDCRSCGSKERRLDPKLIIRVINFELVQPLCSWYLNVTEGRLTTAISHFDYGTCIAM